MTDDDDLLAAEFALGLLDAQAAAAVAERARANAPLSLRIAWWRDQLTPLVQEVEIPPPEGLWEAIAARLPANDNAARVRLWQGVALAASAVAAVLLAIVATRPAPAPVVVTRQAPAPMVAMLTGEGGAQIAIAYEQAAGRIMISPNALDARAGDAELWLIPSDGKPRSMGVFDDKTKIARDVSAAMRPLVREGAMFAVSLEPRGGSPSGAPTGPVVASGKIIAI